MQPKPLLLIVDDVHTNIQILAEALEKEYRLKIADNGPTALKIASISPQPDLILLDIMMPEMDGFEVCRRLKADKNTAHIDIIFVTAKNDAFDETKGLELGAVDYITKPISFSITRTRIHNHITLRKQKQQLLEEIKAHKAAQDNLLVAGLVYDNTSEAMLLTDSENRILASNPAFSKITGYSQEEILGKTPNILHSDKHDYLFYQAMLNTIETTGNWQGEIWNKRKNGQLYAEWLKINTIYNKDGSVRQRVTLFSDITEKKTNEELIWRQANYDPLTNLPNRRLFQERLQREIIKAERYEQQLSVFFIDLDHFKQINDTQGHDKGDLLLIQAAQRLLKCVRESDTVARLGGDEFTIILVDITNPAIIERIAQKIIEAIAAPFILGHKPFYISASIGITSYPNDSKSIDALLKNADQAMYISKENGRGQFTYFTSSMQKEAQARMQIIKDLRSALDEEQFILEYQPIYSIDKRHIENIEVLLRWEHPRRGLIYPNEFITLAEETGLITAINDWVFYQATKQLTQWHTQGYPDIQISINISHLQLMTGNSSKKWEQHLKKQAISGDKITLEITQHLLLNITPNVLQQLKHLKHIGIKIAFDDFGTGCSNISYLKQVDIDYLKMDRSLIQSLVPESNNLELSEAIILMAHKLNCQVIAKGVETLEQKHLLLNAGCDYAQGFLYSGPVSAQEISKMLKDSSLS